jgi:serine/threonine protein kinase
VTSREPISPPKLDGYRNLGLLGSGGFADVFLYEQEFPRTNVAIKFLVGDAVGDQQRQRFTDEANAMASVSNHPFIVSIFGAGVSPEGYPYMVLEYYPLPNFSQRYKSERFQVADVLRVGIQIASAVETAHRIHILHRDIKPANILTSEYGQPGLTDFGIAAAKDQRADEAEGMSIPWSPPEVVVGDGVSDERSDVYSLAATMYSILAARSPFEVAGERNRAIDLIGRIQQLPVPAIDRPDIPGSLQRLLAQAMAKDPDLRPATAAKFAVELQGVEVEQRFSVTDFQASGTTTNQKPVDVSTPIDPDAGSTRVKPPTVIESQTADGTTRHRSSAEFGNTFIRPPRPPVQGPVRKADGSIIHSTPYIPSAPDPAARAMVRPPVARRDTTSPAAGLYGGAQPQAIAIPRSRNTTLIFVSAAVAVVLVMVAAGTWFLVLNAEPDPIVERVTLQESETECQVNPVWANEDATTGQGDATGDDLINGIEVNIESSEKGPRTQPVLEGTPVFKIPKQSGEVLTLSYRQVRDGKPFGKQENLGVCA